jgi:integrase
MNSATPIRKESDIKKLKKYLAGNKRDLFYFILGINTGIRSGDLLKLRVKDLKYAGVGVQIPIIEEKTGKQNYIQTFPGQPGYHNGVLQNCQNSVDA